MLRLGDALDQVGLDEVSLESASVCSEFGIVRYNCELGGWLDKAFQDSETEK